MAAPSGGGLALAIVLDFFFEDRGGTERYLAELARQLSARGWRVVVYAVAGRAPAPAVELKRIAPRGFTRAAREVDFAERSVAQARADRCDLVLGIRHVIDVDVYQPHGGSWAASVEHRLAGDRSVVRRRLRAAWHRLSPKHRHFLRCDREVFARRPGLLTLAVSPGVRDDLLTRYGAWQPRIEVVWPAVDTERFHPRMRAADGQAWRARHGLGPGLGTPVVAFLGHDFELKGLRHALEAFARSDARRSGAILVVGGRGERGPFERFAGRLGLGASVHFLGAVAEVAELLAGADLLLHPTWHDPCALVTLEALAAGVPVVTTALNGAAALLDGTNGRVVTLPEESAALAGAIDALLCAGPAARAAAAASGRRLGWAEHIERMIQLLASARRAR